MPRDNFKSRGRDQELAEYRALQQEMTAIGHEQGQTRLAAWNREVEDMTAAWEGFQQDWQGTLQQMAGAALAKFDEISARGEASGNHLAQSWRQCLAEITGEVDAWGEQVMQTLDKVGSGFQFGLGGGGTGQDWLSWLGLGFDFGGIFHEGGIVEAHRGLAVAPEALLGDERLVKVQTGEGILPREAMVRLGEDNFEALRSGNLQMNQGPAGPRYDITIQVQSLDAASAAGMDWERVVQRHLLPALERELGQRW